MKICYNFVIPGSECTGNTLASADFFAEKNTAEVNVKFILEAFIRINKHKRNKGLCIVSLSPIVFF